MCLAFRQAVKLAEALAGGDLRTYAAEHRHMMRCPRFMADVMLMLDRFPRSRVVTASNVPKEVRRPNRSKPPSEAIRWPLSTSSAASPLLQEAW